MFQIPLELFRAVPKHVMRNALFCIVLQKQNTLRREGRHNTTAAAAGTAASTVYKGLLLLLQALSIFNINVNLSNHMECIVLHCDSKAEDTSM